MSRITIVGIGLVLYVLYRIVRGRISGLAAEDHVTNPVTVQTACTVPYPVTSPVW